MKNLKLPLLSLFFLLLAGCGAEQFGTVPQSDQQQPNPIKQYDQSSCSNHTLIKPEVDILYVVDNSTSNYYISSSVQSAIQNTINSISNQFDYRVIGTPLIQTSGGNNDYQVLAKSPETLPASAINNNKVVSSSSQFNFFNNHVNGSLEPGLARVQSFIAHHAATSPTPSTGLFRQKAYLFVVLVSNGWDTDIEVGDGEGGSVYTTNGSSIFTSRKNSLSYLKNTVLQSQQFRIFSLVTHPGCTKSGWRPAEKSYMEMSRVLYQDHSPALTDQAGKTWPDSYDLCQGNVSSVFAAVNSSIQQIIVPHEYRMWPLTNIPVENLDTGSIRVYKKSPTSGTTLLTKDTQWTYFPNPSGASQTITTPDSPVETSSAPHFVKFVSGNEISYPDCVSVSSTSNVEYFGFIVIPKIPKLESVQIKINGLSIPKSNTNGWSYIGEYTNKNIKVSHNGYSNLPAALRSGYFIQLNGANNYYQSGDNVEIHYVPASN